jgi:DNA-binding MarR family transcriptional regulator
VRLSLTDDGLRLLAGVTERRVEEIRRIVERIRPEERPKVLAAFQAFAAAAGEVSDAEWAARWTV